MYFDSSIECEARAQLISNATGNDYVVWFEKLMPHRFFYTKDNQDNTSPVTWYRGHWATIRPQTNKD